MSRLPVRNFANSCEKFQRGFRLCEGPVAYGRAAVDKALSRPTAKGEHPAVGGLGEKARERRFYLSLRLAGTGRLPKGATRAQHFCGPAFRPCLRWRRECVRGCV